MERSARHAGSEIRWRRAGKRRCPDCARKSAGVRRLPRSRPWLTARIWRGSRGCGPGSARLGNRHNRGSRLTTMRPPSERGRRSSPTNRGRPCHCRRRRSTDLPATSGFLGETPTALPGRCDIQRPFPQSAGPNRRPRRLGRAGENRSASTDNLPGNPVAQAWRVTRKRTSGRTDERFFHTGGTRRQEHGGSRKLTVLPAPHGRCRGVRRFLPAYPRSDCSGTTRRR